MDLRDASGKAAVNQFIRSLSFPFPMEIVAGIPGSFFGPSINAVDERSALLMHEIEHLITLTSPLGLVYTALAWHLKNEHDRLGLKWNDWQARIQEDPLPGVHEEASSLVEGFADQAAFTRFVLRVSQYFLPLLEGLAVIAEMELSPEEDSQTFSLMLSFEFWRAYYVALLTNPKEIISFQDDSEREKMVHLLMDRLDEELEASRKIRRLLMGDRLFFTRAASDEPDASAPYFQGYLFVRRLMQQWKFKAPELKTEQLHEMARAAISSLLPLTLLMARLKPGDADSPANLDAPTIEAAIRSLLSLSRRQLREISQGKLLAYDLERKGLTLVSGTDDPDEDVMSWVLAGVFGKLDPDQRKQVRQVLWVIERSKFVKALDTRPAVLAGLNDKHQLALLLAETEVVDEKTLGSRSATWFVFRDEDFKAFVRDFDANAPRFSRVDLQRMPIRMPVPDTVLVGRLSTFCFFYPFGVRTAEKDRGLATPMAVIQRLAVPSGDDVKVFESGLISIPGSAEALALQTLHAGFASAVDAVLDPTLEAYRSAVTGIHDLYRELLGRKIIEDSLADAIRRTDERQDQPEDDMTPAEEEFYEYVPRVFQRCRALLTELSPNWYDEMRNQSQVFYTRLLFPRCGDTEGLLANKLDFLNAYVSTEDLDTLRVWLLYGAVLSRGRAYTPEPGEDIGAIRNTVERIRSVCLEHLGVPMVAFDEGTQKVTLDILPPPIQ